MSAPAPRQAEAARSVEWWAARRASEYPVGHAMRTYWASLEDMARALADGESTDPGEPYCVYTALQDFAGGDVFENFAAAWGREIAEVGMFIDSTATALKRSLGGEKEATE